MANQQEFALIISTVILIAVCVTHDATGSGQQQSVSQSLTGTNSSSEQDNHEQKSKAELEKKEPFRRRSLQMAPEVASSRSNSGYGSGGGGSYNSGTMMYYSNFDTALTTLAFLSFGVFLLNMIFSFLDFGTPLGPVTREDVGGKDVDGLIKLERRSTGSGGTPTMSPAALLALSAIQQTLLDNNNNNDDGENATDQQVDDGRRPECAFRLFCDASRHPELRERLDGMFSALTSFILTGKLRTNRKLWESAKLHQLLAMMQNGGCDELIRMCSTDA